MNIDERLFKLFLRNSVHCYFDNIEIDLPDYTSHEPMEIYYKTLLQSITMSEKLTINEKMDVTEYIENIYNDYKKSLKSD
jgi:hypothetical protein